MGHLSMIVSPSRFAILLVLITGPLAAQDKEGGGPESGHPRPSYADYSKQEMKVLADAVRSSRPTMHRGGWEWDRLLTRYIDSHRKDHNELIILRAYFLSMLDRYNEAKAKDEPFTIFYTQKVKKRICGN